MSATTHLAMFAGRKGLFPWEEPLFASNTKHQRTVLLLLDDHFYATVLGTSSFRVVTGDWVAVSVAFGR